MSVEHWFRVVPGQQRWRWDLNPRKGCPFTRFRVLGTAVRHRVPAYVTCANCLAVLSRERLRTEVNETETETEASGGPRGTGLPIAGGSIACPGPRMRLHSHGRRCQYTQDPVARSRWSR